MNLQMKKLINFRPTLFSVVGIIISLYSAFLYVKGKVFVSILILALLFILSLVLSFVCKKENIKRNLIFTLILFFVCTLTVLGFIIVVNDYNSQTLDNGYYEVEGKVIDVSFNDGHTILVLDDVYVKGPKEGKIDYKIRVYVGGSTYVDVGDVASFYTKISDSGIKYDGRYSWHDVASNVKYFCSVAREDIAVTEKRLNVFERTNLFIRNTLKSGMDEDSFAVTYALICGNSDYENTQVFDGYRRAGVAHIFAVSGLHVGFLSTFAYFLIGRFKMNEYLKIILILTILFLYSGVCGFSSSSLRATLMFGVLSFARASGKRYDMISSISLAFIIIAVIDPIQVFTAGFILSFGVVYGIAICSGPMTRALKFLPKKIGANLAMVVSAQIYFIPLSIAIFGEFSLIALVANLVFIPFVSLLYVFTFVLTVIGGLFSIQTVTLFIPNFIFKWINYLVNAFDYDVFIIGGFVLGGFTIAYYLITLLLSGMFNLKRLLKTILTLVVTVVFLVGTVYVNVYDRSIEKLYVYGESDVCVSVVTGEQNVMVVSYVKDNFSIKRLSKLSTNNQVEIIDKLIVLDSYTDVDTFSLISGLRQVFTIKEVFYPEKTDLYDHALKAYFIDTDFRSYTTSVESYEFFGDVFSVCYGKGLEVNIGQNKILIFSEFGDYVNRYSGYSFDRLDTIVAYDSIDGIYQEYKTNRFVSYLPYKKYQNANSCGYYVCEIK